MVFHGATLQAEPFLTVHMPSTPVLSKKETKEALLTGCHGACVCKRSGTLRRLRVLYFKNKQSNQLSH